MANMETDAIHGLDRAEAKAMFNYLAFLHGGLTAPSERPFADGESLAAQCIDGLRKIDNPEQFPPRLLILLASPAYREQPKAAQLVAGVRQAFVRANYKEIPLIGSSVAAVFFERQIHERGALLICLASRLLEATVAVGPNANQDPGGALRDLLRGLELESPPTEDTNPFGDRTLFTFFPGGASDSSPEELHRRLTEAVMARLPIVGGVSSVNDPERTHPGLQFAGHDVYRGALVAARIITGCQIGTSLGMGLDATGRFVQIKTISEDTKTIEKFHEGAPVEALKEEMGLVLLGRRTWDHDLVMALRRPGAGDEPVEILRHIKENWPLEIFKPDPQKMCTATAQAVQRSMQKFSMERIVACLALICASHYRYREEIGLDIEAGVEEIEKTVKNQVCVGGFVDGEAGIDKSGRSIFTNWSVVAIAFGDGMRARTPSQRGFAALAEHSPALNQAESIEDAIKESLQLVFDVGFPGAMISLLMPDQGKRWIVAQDAIGSRFGRIVEDTRRDLEGGDILAIVAREGESRFIRDSRREPSADKPAIMKSGIISQFVMPLRGMRANVLATLQVDLGDVTYRERLHDTEEQVLHSLGAAIGECLRRVFHWEEARIASTLDTTLVESLSAATLGEGVQHFIEGAIQAFGTEMGHVRLVDREKSVLRLAAGVGPYYYAAKEVRPEIDFIDDSPSGRTFLDGKATVVNDAENDPGTQALRGRYRDRCLAPSQFDDIRSYANVAFKNSQGEKTGTIIVGSSRNWFFSLPLLRSLDALSQRAGFLEEHLKGRLRLKFLSDVGPQLAEAPDFRNSRALLKQATARFCRAANAQVAALYLWDNELEKYLLRAQEGWFDPDWVGAARYGERDGWTGSMALIDRPLYVTDLRALKTKSLGEATGRYRVQMFGSDPPESLRLEAIALPLKVGNKRIGVLTLHRRVPRSTGGGTSGFVTTEQKVLQEAADDMAGLVNALMSFQATVWEQQERERRGEVYRVLIQQDNGRDFKDRLCRQVVTSFHASRAILYLPPGEKLASELSVAAAYPPPSRDGSLAPTEPDDLVLNAMSSGKVAVGRKTVTDAQRTDPKLAALEELVNRACIPIRVENNLYGVLDLHWNLPRDDADPFLTRNDSNQLQILGDMISSAYHGHMLVAEREEAEARAERSRVAVHAMGAMVFQSAHRFKNLLQNVVHVKNRISDARDEGERAAAIARLSTLIDTSAKSIERPMDVASRVAGPEPILQPLRELLLSECTVHKRQDIEVSVQVAEDLFAWIDRELTREALHNLIENSVKAMPNGGVLTLSARAAEDGKDAIIELKDTGVGMTKEELQAARSGFFSTQTKRGVGVLIATVLMSAQGGTLDVQSAKGVGTRVTLTMRLTRTEEKR